MKHHRGRFVPLFPLPNAVLFPRILQPLYIFEPRYRRMLSEVLDSYGKIALALMKPGHSDIPGEDPEIFDVIGVGQVWTYDTLPDGTSNVFLVGEFRARITGWDDASYYRTVSVEELPEKLPPAAARRDELRLRLKGWLRSLTKGWERKGDFQKLQKVFASHTDIGFLTDFMAHHFLEDPMEKQSLLEELDVERRAERLHEMLRSRKLV